MPIKLLTEATSKRIQFLSDTIFLKKHLQFCIHQISLRFRHFQHPPQIKGSRVIRKNRTHKLILLQLYCLPLIRRLKKIDILELKITALRYQLVI